MGTYGIKIKGDAQHEADVTKTIETIANNAVGKAILKLIEQEDEDLTIVPYTKGDHCNAETFPTAERHWAPKGVQPYKGLDDWNGTRNHDEREEKVSYTGTGKGANVKLHFSANVFGASDCNNGLFGAAADVTLLHELVHGLRYMQGIANFVPTNGTLRPYKNEEEYLAVNVANVYISASGSTLLRADYDGFKQLAPHLTTSAGFLAEPGHHELMSIHLVTWRSFFEALSPILVRFNPFSMLYWQTNRYYQPDKPKRQSKDPLPSRFSRR